MKRVLMCLLFVACALLTMAQPNYKYILVHLPEYSDREALYRLQDYQGWYPKQPHPYYLLANLEYKLYKNEHSILDYYEKERSLYNAQLYYGNCKAFIGNDRIKADMYPAAAVGDKLTEEQLSAWLIVHRDSARAKRDNLEALYEAYSRLVLCYDSCGQDFATFCRKYSRQKDALMMLDSLDEALLKGLSARAAKLPGYIDAYQKALQKSPIEGYQPTFHFVPIEYYRLEGITGADFLKNEIALWDYSGWIASFNQELKDVNRMKKSLLAEHKRLSKGQISKKGENISLLNNVRRYDATSPASDLLHLEFLSAFVQNNVNAIRVDSLAEEDWLPTLQRSYKTLLLLQEARDVSKGLAARWNNADAKERYRGFLAAAFPKGEVQSAPRELVTKAEMAWSELEAWLLQQTEAHPEPVQISETQSAQIVNGHLVVNE